MVTAIAIVYVLLLGAAITAIFINKKKMARTVAIICLCLMAVPLLLVGAFYVWVRITLGPAPPTLSEIQKEFPKHRTDLETIVQMSNQDAEFARVAPDFDFKFSPNQSDTPKDLPKERWDEYRRIFARNDIRLGILRDQQTDVFIMINSEGLLDMGHASGYLYCSENPEVAERRFEPCTSKESSGSQPYTNEKTEAYSFIKLADHWYAFDQGPG